MPERAGLESTLGLSVIPIGLFGKDVVVRAKGNLSINNSIRLSKFLKFTRTLVVKGYMIYS